ncbi:TKL/TKL-ccin protein kinase [Mycena floridula]|nr:TKL/TKL-ccin protein kinase [Mycena floridula]
MTTLRSPKAPPDSLRLESSAILARLWLIIEFKPWLDYTRLYLHLKHEQPVKLLWDCFALGAPLCTLLNLLGAPTPNSSLDKFNFDLAMADRERFVISFIQRVQMLEVQGRLAYGEVLRMEDLFGGTSAGFFKVLRTVRRVLQSLADSYPGIYVTPSGAKLRRSQCLEDLLETERAHVSYLRLVSDAAEAVSETLQFMEPCLECLLVNRTRLRKYHDRVLSELQAICRDPTKENWDIVFTLSSGSTRTSVIGAYRSICANHLALSSFLHRMTLEPDIIPHAEILLKTLPRIPSRMSDYSTRLQEILSLTLPNECPGYESLCSTIFILQNICDNMDEMSWQIRTDPASKLLKTRAGIDLAFDTGALILDDMLRVEARPKRIVAEERWLTYSVYLFEAMLICCLDRAERAKEAEPHEIVTYPVTAWELGPASRRTTRLNLVHAVPTKNLKVLRYGEFESTFEIDWADEREDDEDFNTLEFMTTCPAQTLQWREALQMFVPCVTYEQPIPQISLYEENDESPYYSEDDDEVNDGRIISNPRPWSLIGRKGPRSETSSFIQQELSNETEMPLSPNLLPDLFNHNNNDIPWRPLSVSPGETFPFEMTLEDQTLEIPHDGVLLDLTGKIKKEGRFPAAHGGFADVWKGVWRDGQHERLVAIKVLRSGVDDPLAEEKMKRRLAREMDAWKNLKHPNILPLYGTTSDPEFGRYQSMVCPWLQHGSVSKYMEQHGDILSMTDRLQLLREVAEGLRYLHSESIVHGDLSGANILIDHKGTACLADFGLSSIAKEFETPSYFTSSIGGAVRWADPLLHKYHDRTEPVLGPWNDIYSFGSVMLELLSGRIPYHYIKIDAQVVIELHRGVKPRRPAPLFVTDRQWEFIMKCWKDSSADRPGIDEVCDGIQALVEASRARRPGGSAVY